MNDTRQLITFEKHYGVYAIAGAIFSYGDVVDFVEGPKQGIVIIDTCGHVKEFGTEMSAFLRREIEGGWGIGNDAQEDLLELGKRLRSLRKPGQTPYDITDRWHDYVSGMYAQIDEENISLSMGGGLGHTFIFRKDGDLEKILMQGGTIDHNYITNHEPAHNTTLRDDEVLLLQSDGLVINTIVSLDNDAKSAKIKKEWENIGEYTESLIINNIKENKEKTAEEIRNSLISELGKYFLPRSMNYDDVTFAVVKRA